MHNLSYVNQPSTENPVGAEYIWALTGEDEFVKNNKKILLELMERNESAPQQLVKIFDQFKDWATKSPMEYL